MTDAQEILFGKDQTSGIVAVETVQDRAIVYRSVQGNVVREEYPFSPWLLLESRLDIPGANYHELDGDGYRFFAEFQSWSEFSAARYALRDNHTPHFVYANPVKQYLTITGQTLFKDMTFDDVHRMQVDIETYDLSPNAPENEVFLIAVSDNRGLETVLEGNEPDLLSQIVEIIRDVDPDVIEGHNIFGFDLPYLAKRAEFRGINLAFGRDGSNMSFGAPRSCPIGGTTRPYTPANIFGRHVVDTLLGVQRYDVAKGSLTSHTLKDCAVALGLAEPDRVVIPHEEIADRWKTNPDHVKIYALQDVLETRSLAALVSPAEFYLTQMIPDSYGSVTTTGTGEKINSIMIREYLRQGKSIPKPQPPSQVPGGYTDIKIAGKIDRVVKCDVESLYPSLMLTKKIQPESDALNVFLPALEELTRRRIEAKSLVKSATGQDRAYWDGLQGSFKILINSFYGYLGAPFNFNDFSAAEKITTAGQDIVKRIVSELEATNSKVIEIDTDGVYFQPPADVVSEDDEIKYVGKIDECLPNGINLAHDGRYKTMVSLKRKNYILVDYDGKKILKGASLRSRADELFGREFMLKAIDLLIEGRQDAIAELYSEVASDIQSGRLPVSQFARRERVTEKTFTSSSKKRIAAAIGSAQVGDFVNIYNRADGSIGLVSDYQQDEDRDYLLDKLYKFACRIREAFGDEFDSYFPKPGRKSKAESAGQQTLGLFD